MTARLSAADRRRATPRDLLGGGLVGGAGVAPAVLAAKEKNQRRGVPPPRCVCVAYWASRGVSKSWSMISSAVMPPSAVYHTAGLAR